MRLSNYPAFQTTDPEEANKQFAHEFHSRTRIFSPRFSLFMRSVKLRQISVVSTVSRAERETWTESRGAPYSLIFRRGGTMRCRLRGGREFDFEPGQIRLFAPDCDLRCSIRGDSDLDNIGIIIPAEYLQQQAERIVGHPVELPFDSTGLFDVRCAAGRRIEWMLNDLETADSAFYRQKLNGRNSEENLITALVEQTPNSYRPLLERNDRTIVTMWHIDRAREYILAHLLEPSSTIADAAHSAGIGLRALERSYKMRYGRTLRDFREAMRARFAELDRPESLHLVRPG